jgi:hypothetical protein
MKTFELTGETKVNAFGITLFRIRCTVAIEKYSIKPGDIGGWIESEEVNGNARVSGNAWVYGDAQVSGNARVGTQRELCWFSIFGSRNGTTTAYRIKGGIEITCGCFRGSLDAFIEKVKSTHRGSDIAKEYFAICEVIKIRFKVE